MAESTRRTLRRFLIVTLLAMLPRLILALSLPADDTVFEDRPYHDYAQNLAAGRGFYMGNPYNGEIGPEKVYAFRPPLFPFLWSLVLHATGGAYAPVRVTFALLSGLGCGLAFLVGLELFPKRPATAFLGGLLCAFYPPLIWHSVHLMSEPLFIFFSIAMLLALLRFVRTGRWRALVAAGVSAGLATMARSIMVAFLPVAALWLLWVRGRNLRALGETALFALVVTTTMMPWIVRNAYVFGAFVPTTTDAGHGFYVANNPAALDDSRGFAYPDDWSDAAPAGLDELETSRQLMRNTARYLLHHPGTALRLMARRFGRLWAFFPSPEFVGGRKALVYGLSYIPLFPFILLGVWLGHRRGTRAMANMVLGDLLVLYTTAMATVFLAMLRYRAPLMPFLIICAAQAMLWTWDRLAAKTQRAAVERLPVRDSDPPR